MNTPRRVVAVMLILIGTIFILLPFLPGVLLILAGAGIFSPRTSQKLRAWRDRIVYRRMGGR